MANNVCLGQLLHGLMHCSQASRAREFLSRQPTVRGLLCAALEEQHAWDPGVSADGPHAGPLARLVALLMLQTGRGGGEAQASLLAHVQPHLPSYVALLAPTIRDCFVQSALLMLSSCVSEGDELLSISAAQHRLQFLVALLHAVVTSPACGCMDREALLEVLAQAFCSIFNAVVVVETRLRHSAADALRERCAGDLASSEDAPMDRREFMAEVDSIVRSQLPVTLICHALSTVARLPPSFIHSLTQPCCHAAHELLIALVRLELLWERVPARQRNALHALPAILECGEQIGCLLHRALNEALHGTAMPASRSLGLLHMLGTVKGILRAMEVATTHQLVPVVGVPCARLKTFLRRVLLGRSDMTPGAAAGHGCSNARLLWQLVCGGGAGGRGGAVFPVTRKACDILLWCLTHSVQPLQPISLQLAAEAVLAEGDPRAALLVRNPLCQEVAQALLASEAALSQLAHAPALASMASLRQLVANTQPPLDSLFREEAAALAKAQQAGGSGGIPGEGALDRLSAASLDALDGLCSPPRAPHCPASGRHGAAEPGLPPQGSSARSPPPPPPPPAALIAPRSAAALCAPAAPSTPAHSEPDQQQGSQPMQMASIQASSERLALLTQALRRKQQLQQARPQGHLLQAPSPASQGVLKEKQGGSFQEGAVAPLVPAPAVKDGCGQQRVWDASTNSLQPAQGGTGWATAWGNEVAANACESRADSDVLGQPVQSDKGVCSMVCG